MQTSGKETTGSCPHEGEGEKHEDSDNLHNIQREPLHLDKQTLDLEKDY